MERHPGDKAAGGILYRNIFTASIRFFQENPNVPSKEVLPSIFVELVLAGKSNHFRLQLLTERQ